MFLVTDKLEKTDLKYDLMKDEKRDLMKEENEVDMITETTTSYKFDKLHILYSFLIGIVFFIFVWMMMSPKFYHPQLSDVEDQIFKTTMNVVNDAQFIVNKVKERSATMSEENKQAAAQYVNGIRDILKERTHLGVQKLNEVISDKLAEMKSELLAFDGVITEAAKGIVDYAQSDLREIKNTIATIESGDAAESLDKAIRQVEEELTNTFRDIDEMYTFYGRYIGDIIEHKLHNTTDRINMMLHSQRKYCDCTIMDRINVCYNITAQNDNMSSNLKSVVKVVQILSNTTDTVNNMEWLFTNSDQHSLQFFEESKSTLNRALQTTRQTLDSILRNDDCFLGSAIRKESFLKQASMNRFILRSFRTSILNLATNFNQTTSGFEVVKSTHWNQVKLAIDDTLEQVGKEIKAKAMLINTTARDNYIEKANFGSLKTWMHDKFENVTSVINPMYQTNQYHLAQCLKCNLDFIISDKLPFISSTSLKNYLPTDTCPLAADYQKYISLTVEDFIRNRARDTIEDMFVDADYYSDDTLMEAEQPEDADEMNMIEVDVIIQDGPTNNNRTLGLQETPNENAISDLNRTSVGVQTEDVSSSTVMTSLMNLVQTIIQNFTDAGYQLDGPVEIYINEGENKK